MKFLWPFVFLSFNAFSAECNVYGISDSPQRINCYIHQNAELEPLSLFCKNGVYNIVWKNARYKVEQAYHEEVERGSTPLIFQTASLSLKTISLHIYGQAKLSTKNGSFDGICFFK